MATITSNYTPAGTITKSQANTVPLVATPGWDKFLQINDNMAVIDNQSETDRTLLRLADSVTYTDSLRKAATKQLNDVLASSDSIKKIFKKVIQDNPSLTDTIFFVAKNKILLTEQIAFVDVITLGFDRSQRFFTDPLPITDFIRFSVSSRLSLSDSVPFTDRVTFPGDHTMIRINDAIKISDYQHFGSTTTIKINDQFVLLDSLEFIKSIYGTIHADRYIFTEGDIL